MFGFWFLTLMNYGKMKYGKNSRLVEKSKKVRKILV